MLAMLYKDERVANVAAVPQFPFLEKMLMERLITKYALKSYRAQSSAMMPCTRHGLK
jgi:hypothetical protein